jgi:cytochrome P450
LDIAGNPRDFAYATFLVSKHLFGKPPIQPQDNVDKAADYVRSIVKKAIAREKNEPSGRQTVLAGLVKMNKPKNHLTDEQICAFLMGMIIGFVPTNTIAGGHILEMLLRRKDFQSAAREAAMAGDDDFLRHCLFEAMRFMPLNPGPFRRCERDHILAAGTPRAAKIRRGTYVLASTMSAMFDARQIDKPFEFNPQRPASDYMLFGYGMHWCAGVFIAQAQITQTLKALLRQPKLERASRKDGAPRYRDLFPDRLCVRFR